MIDKRLVRAIPGSMGRALLHASLQWIALIANIYMIWSLSTTLAALWKHTATSATFANLIISIAIAAIVRVLTALGTSRMAHVASRAVKQRLRRLIFDKLLRLGSSYRSEVRTSEVVQLAVEGVDQLEIYFAAYMPQLIYAVLAPLTLFAFLAPMSLTAALILLVCVPLIPISIAAVQTWAKKLLSKYWGNYTELGDTFLENLQGLTTLKVYQADAFKQQEMNEQAEQFRRITMRVLTMQLNSITIMDLVAYGGAAAGMAVALVQLAAGEINLAACLTIILLAADYFLPMRQLGSFFHIAMNGMAASDKIFRLLALSEPPAAGERFPERTDICVRDLRFAYEGETKAEAKKRTDGACAVEAGAVPEAKSADQPRSVLAGVDLTIPQGSFVAIVGESGCGKSTFASLLLGRLTDYAGSLTVGGVEVSTLDERDMLNHVTYVGHASNFFKGTVRDNLRMAAPTATDDELWQTLETTRIASFLRVENGLDTQLAERAANLSGGQRQRLSVARALLHNTPIYVFDEATSNIDVESEDAIMEAIHALAGMATVILISHRLANVTDADEIVVFDAGCVAERGSHRALLNQHGHYAELWHAQQELETYGQNSKKADMAELVALETNTSQEESVSYQEVVA